VGAHEDPASRGRIQSERAARLLELLGLTEDELCALLDVDPLTLLSGQLDHRPELPILLDLLAEAEERAGAPVLRRWVRAAGPAGRPIDALTRRDFPAFEDALGELAEQGRGVMQPMAAQQPPVASGPVVARRGRPARA
jgi:hypothetical protein